MKRQLIFVITFSIFFYSCTHNILQYENESELEYFNKISSLCEKNKPFEIKMISGNQFKAKDIKIDIEKTSFTLEETDELRIVETSSIDKIIYTQKGRGLFEGLLYGALIGSLTGVILSGGGQQADIYFIGKTTVLSSFLGSIYGYIKSSETVIQFRKK